MGLPEFRGRTEINATPSEGIITRDDTQSTDVPGADTDKVQIFADAGEIWELEKIFVLVSSVGAGVTGNHRFEFNAGDALTLGELKVGEGSIAGTESISYQSGEWVSGSGGTIDVSRADMEGTKADEDTPFEVIYSNSTSTTQTNNRKIRTEWRTKKVV